jgi:hypothetical protein
MAEINSFVIFSVRSYCPQHSQTMDDFVNSAAFRQAMINP